MPQGVGVGLARKLVFDDGGGHHAQTPEGKGEALLMMGAALQTVINHRITIEPTLEGLAITGQLTSRTPQHPQTIQDEARLLVEAVTAVEVTDKTVLGGEDLIELLLMATDKTG